VNIILNMETYNAYNNYYAPLSSNLLGLGGNCDRLTGVPRTYDIFSSFALPKIPTPAYIKDDIFLSDDEENVPKPPRLPLFSRCPVTNRAHLEAPAPAAAGGKMKSSMSLSPMKNLHIGGGSGGNSPIKRSPMKLNMNANVNGGGHSPRVPLLNIGNQCNRNICLNEQNKVSYSQVAKKPADPEPAQLSCRRSPLTPTSPSPPPPTQLPTSTTGRQRQASSSPLSFNQKPPSNSSQLKNTTVKPSLDDVKDDSLVAMTNKHGKGKYWFKSGCPTPDPRWPACQQLMIGPIPGDVEYSTLRSAFLSKGHTIHLFIQNNQAWLEKNQEKFGKKQVKFGYVVYTDNCVAARLLAAGHVLVGHVRVAVKQMDGQPAQFVN